MKKLILIPILVLLVSAQTYSTTNCVCGQLLSSDDCTKLGGLNCLWDSKNSKCATSSTVTPSTPAVAQYCDPFSSTDCPNTTGCALVSSKCIFFTGCTPFAKTTDSDCQAISSRCITDGTHCVEKNACNTYLKQLPCVKNAAGAYCYWDTTNNVCVDATTCDKLPSSLASDQDCRAQISTCTAKTGGGCVDSGANCSDQTTQISCVQNKVQSQACYWNSTACVDKICANAPNTLTTDDACTSFKTDGSCTTKSGGGCVTRTTCSAAAIQAACVKNSSGSSCFWNGTACVDKICSNAPATMTTNSACQGFISTCITTGAGCTNGGACSAATVQVACDKNSSGGACIWNNTCKDKTCGNAPATNTTHDLCTTYLGTCTVNSGANGCQDRTCANAPSTIVTNENCEAYLPGSHCVAKAGGGCVTNAACSTLGQVACVKDISGNDCVWGTTCQDKICVNAPASANTHALCQSYLKTCTVNSSGTCVTETCENIQTSDVCTTDFNGNPCIYKGKCYQLQCAQATTQTTHTACQSFSTKCTLSNSGTGCVPIPLNCSAITLQAACNLRLDPVNITANCGWNGTKCIDKDCTTLDKTITTSAACSNIQTGGLAGCVLANPVGSAAATGCMALPATCSGRQTSDSCVIQGAGTGAVTCVWDSSGTSTTSCVLKTCLTASITTTTGYLQTINNTTCGTYLTGTACFLNAAGTGCMASVSDCTTLTSQTTCQYIGIKNGSANCYWNATTSKCVELACTNIPLTSHLNCHKALNTCTVNGTSTNCLTLAACNTYTIADQCKINASGKSCIWIGTSCRDEVCTDADITNTTAANCAALKLTGTTPCNILANVSGSGGCSIRQATCSLYFEKSTCVADISGNACSWQGTICYQLSTMTCANIVLTTWDVAHCEGVIASCTVNAATNGCQTKVCSDYSTQNGLTGGTAVSTDAHCSAILSTCTIDNTSGHVKCQTKQSTCAGYGTAAAGPCTVATEGNCYWTGAACAKIPSVCTGITLSGTYSLAACEAVISSCTVNGTTNGCQTKVCADYTKTNGLSTGATAVAKDSDCSALLSTCTIGSGGACQTKLAACSSYTSPGICTVATEGVCNVNVSASCFLPVSCSVIHLASYNEVACESILTSCTVNGTTDGCQAKVCSDYTKTDGTSTGGTAVASDSDCSKLLSSCTIGNAACQTKQANCSGYGGQPACTVATEGQCYWTGAACAKTPSACTGITLTGTYSLAACEVVISTCTVNGTTNGCQTKVCSDYTKTNGLSTGGTAVAKDSDCSKLLSTCTMGASACQTKQATCAGYTATGQTTCLLATEGKCFWTGTACILPSATNCASNTGSVNSLTDTIL